MNLKTLRAALAAIALLCCGSVSSQSPDFSAMYCVDGKNMTSHCFDSKQKAMDAITRGTLALHSANKWLVDKTPLLPSPSNNQLRWVFGYDDRPPSENTETWPCSAAQPCPAYYEPLFRTGWDAHTRTCDMVNLAPWKYPTGCRSEDQLITLIRQSWISSNPSCALSRFDVQGEYSLSAFVGPGHASGNVIGEAIFGGRRVEGQLSCPTGVKSLARDLTRSHYINCPHGFLPRNPDATNSSQQIWESGTPCRPNIAGTYIRGPLLQTRSCPANAQPCYPATGDKARFEPDFEFGGQVFQRNYHSIGQYMAPELSSARGAAAWTHSYFRVAKAYYSFRGDDRYFHLDGQGYLEEYRFYVGQTEVPSLNTPGRRMVRNGSSVAHGVTIHEADGRSASFNGDGALTELVHFAGGVRRRITFTHDGEGRIQTATDEAGRQLTFIYNGRALVRIVLPDGQTADYTYDEHGNLASATVAGLTRFYHYGEAGLAEGRPWLLTGITDETGRRYASFGYTEHNRAASSRLHDESGFVESTTLNYVSPTQVDVTTPSGLLKRYTISSTLPRRVTAISDSFGTESTSYSGSGLIQSRTNRRGIVSRYTYANGALTSVTEAEGRPEERRTRTTRNSRNQPTLEVVERRTGSTYTPVLETHRTYDGHGHLLSVRVVDVPAGRERTTSFTRDAEGRVLTIDGPRTDVADVTTFTYFASEDPGCASSPTTCTHRRGDLQSVTNALGQTTHFLRYDGAGRLLESRDANGLVSRFTYTPRGWLASRTVGGLTTTIDYTAVGDVERVTTPDGRSLTYTWDIARRLKAVQDQHGHRIEWTLDNAGNRTAEAVRDANGVLRRTLSQQFDLLGRLRQSANAAGQATLFTNDANGNLDLASDPLNRTDDQDVDALDRVTRQLQDVAGLNVETKFAYDALDQLTTVTDPKGLITRYTNDGLGNLTKLESPDTGTTTYAVDAAGNRTSQTDARGVTVNYAYDALNRLTGITFPTAALNTSFVYDEASGCPAGETFALGRLSSMTDASGSTRWCYDQLGRLTRKVQVTNGRTFTTAYAYDAQGRLSTQTLPSGAIVRFGYASGEVNTVAVRLPGSSVDLPLINGIERLPFGPVSKLTYGNGRTQTRAYDLDYAIDRITSSEASGWTQDYGVDAVGNITSILGIGANNRFTYDGLDRLTKANDTTEVTQRGFAYDKTGNRTAASDALGVSTPYAYPTNSHRLNTVGAQARTYDAVGNPLSIGAVQLRYDERSRLDQVSLPIAQGEPPSPVWAYQYNGQGWRVEKRAGETSTYFVYNENAQLIGEYNNAGARTQEIIWLGNLPVGVIAGATATPVLHYIESDHLGTPRVIVDAARNTAIWRWNQTDDPFGERAPNADPDGDTNPFTFNLRFAGQYRDAETGWHYNVNRTYDPSIGRYLESDPIGLGGGISTYSYVGAAPLTAVDPLGLIKWTGHTHGAGFGLGVFAAATYNFHLRSECVGGRRAIIDIDANFFGGGVGAPITYTISHVTFEDGQNQIRPELLLGEASMLGAGASLGGGVSYSKIRLGEGVAEFGLAAQGGVDATIYGYPIGTSELDGPIRWVECGCGG